MKKYYLHNNLFLNKTYLINKIFYFKFYKKKYFSTTIFINGKKKLYHLIFINKQNPNILCEKLKNIKGHACLKLPNNNVLNQGLKQNGDIFGSLTLKSTNTLMNSHSDITPHNFKGKCSTLDEKFMFVEKKTSLSILTLDDSNPNTKPLNKIGLKEYVTMYHPQ